MKLLTQANAKPDYKLKAKVIENGCVSHQRRLSLAQYKRYQAICIFEESGEIIPEFDELNAKCLVYHNELVSNYSQEEIKEAERVNNASYHRVKRLNDRIFQMLNNKNSIFVTLTFAPDVLAKTSGETRKKYIKRYLKEQCIQYVANIDFGKKNGREHYHAVVIPKNDKLDNKAYNYGSIDFERVRNYGESTLELTSKKMAKYVAKLTNHAIKTTTHQNRIIYSRL